MTEQKQLDISITTKDKKYTVILGQQGKMSFLRHGEPWPAADKEFAFVGLIMDLAADLYETRLDLEQCKKIP